MMKTTTIRTFLGTLLFIGGIIFLGISADWWKISSVYSGAWTFFITIPAIIWIFIFGVNIFNSMMFFTGFGFLLNSTGLVGNQYVVQLIISMAILSVALYIFAGTVKKPVETEAFSLKPKQNDTDKINLSVTLFGGRYTNVSEKIEDGKIKANFCTIAYDISKVNIEKDITLNLSVICGNIVLVIPQDVKVLINSNSFIGKTINKTKQVTTSRTININSSVVNGKIIITDTIPE